MIQERSNIADERYLLQVINSYEEWHEKRIKCPKYRIKTCLVTIEITISTSHSLVILDFLFWSVNTICDIKLADLMHRILGDGL